MTENYRIETDSMGEVRVDASKLWGAQTQRSLMHFQISSRQFPVPFIKAHVEVKRACAIANKEFGLLDQKIADAIIQAADEIIDQDMYLDQFPLDIYQTGSGTQTNMNFNEVLSNRAIQILGGQVGSKKPVHPNDHVNMGQSSNDTIPASMHISAANEIKTRLIPAMDYLVEELEKKQNEFINIVKIGRTHLQDAVPLTLGQEFSGYAAQIKSAKKHIIETSKLLEELAVGGTAVGTGLNAHPQLGQRVSEILSERYEINFNAKNNKFALMASKDSLVAVSGSLKTLAVALTKIANDIRFLASGPRCGLGELSLPENEPGSSIMPGKVNPTQNEMMVQVAAQVIGNDTTVTIGGQGGYFELNLMKPVIISNILESIDILSNGINSFTSNCVTGINANKENIENLVEQSLMLVTGLTKYIGYDTAAKIAKEALKERKNIREIMKEKKLMSEEDLNKALDLSNMVHLERMQK